CHLYGGAGHDRRHQIGMRADRSQRTGDAGAQRQQVQNRHNADSVFFKFAGGRDRASMAASLCGEQAGVSMSDTAPRNPVGAPQMLADALLRTVAGTSALLRVTAASTDTSRSEVGLLATDFAEVTVSPVLMRKLRPY